MNAVDATVDLDDGDGLLAADRNGLLRAAAMAGAQVRATAAALAEGLLDPLRADHPPRTVIWVAGRGTAQNAGAMLAAALSASISAPIVVAAEAPPWLGALDVMIVAGDDPGDPALVNAAATGVRRGARVLIVAPNEGPLRDVAAGRAVRLWVPDDFGLTRFLAAGLAALHVVDPGMRVDLAGLADELDAEALRNSAARELFTNPAKTLVARMSDSAVVLAGDNPATLALARHGAAAMLRLAGEVVAAAELGDVLAAIGSGAVGLPAARSLFHDDEIDGPLPQRMRTFVLIAETERQAVGARVSGFDDIAVIGAEDVPEPAGAILPVGRPEQQLAILAVRMEMTAVYLKLVRG
ncbi:TobH protein [Mycolicibacterium neworleansense]|uniref:TobH protein n=1 Tax=Mycolicibacterium neworleansense TaxID=146018 RepID=A0A0H5RQ69_9MYCO|nr:TobH protein [Mycolicibacterium neworleansense]CRZ15632.1 TobH protein [Mycolicibacterium neworleansense]